MKESEYIDVSNLSRLRDAKSLLRDLFFMEEDDGLAVESRRSVQLLVKIERALSDRIQIEED